MSERFYLALFAFSTVRLFPLDKVGGDTQQSRSRLHIHFQAFGMNERLHDDFIK